MASTDNYLGTEQMNPNMEVWMSRPELKRIYPPQQYFSMLLRSKVFSPVLVTETYKRITNIP